jgi:cytoplasmic iron level regulating protein YaaA (DUF328/UPF0246 family)
MRKLTECHWQIVSEDRDYNEFTIELSKNIDIENKSTKSKSTISPQNKRVKPSKNNNNMTQQTASIDQLNWDNINDKNKNKLLIIGCAGTKIPGGEEIQKNDFSNHESIIEDRNKVLEQYNTLLNNPIPQNYFNKSRRGMRAVDNTYFMNQINNKLFLPALERYSGGRFYSRELKELYKQKNNDCNLHILIVSGLYGILEFTDSIIDYQLEIDKFKIWSEESNRSINEAVVKYMADKKIENDLVFYSLSPTNYKSALKPHEAWHDLWQMVPNGRNANTSKSADYLKTVFLPKLK